MKFYKRIASLVVSAAMLFSLSACSTGSTRQTSSQDLSEATQASSSQAPVSSAEPEQPKEVSLLMIGDDLLHEAVMDSGLQADGSYNYDHLFAHIQEDIDTADIAVINQETILGGAEFGYTGYPMFNSPQEVGDAIAKAGFDVVLHATNHTMDKKYKGVQNTLDFWKKYPDIEVLGIHESAADQAKIPVIEKNGIAIAMLNYTYGLNGLKLPEDKPWLVDLIDKNRMASDIERAKDIADLVVVFPHWGTEYTYEPDSNQQDLTRFFAEQGVDLVIGTHPHVVQPVERVTSSSGHEMLVYYSLGNYVSCQDKAPRMLGGMARVTIQKDPNGTITLPEAGITPLVTHFESKANWNYGVYKIGDYNQDLAAKHGILRSDSSFSLEKMQQLAQQVLGDWIVP